MRNPALREEDASVHDEGGLHPQLRITEQDMTEPFYVQQLPD